MSVALWFPSASTDKTTDREPTNQNAQKANITSPEKDKPRNVGGPLVSLSCAVVRCFLGKTRPKKEHPQKYGAPKMDGVSLVSL